MVHGMFWYFYEELTEISCAIVAEVLLESDEQTDGKSGQ